MALHSQTASNKSGTTPSERLFEGVSFRSGLSSVFSPVTDLVFPRSHRFVFASRTHHLAVGGPRYSVDLVLCVRAR